MVSQRTTVVQSTDSPVGLDAKRVSSNMAMGIGRRGGHLFATQAFAEAFAADEARRGDPEGVEPGLPGSFIDLVVGGQAVYVSRPPGPIA